MIKKINIEENLYSTRLTLLRNQEKINEIIDCFDILKKLEQELYHNHNKKIDNILDDIDSLGERIEELEGKAILKPDYEPEDSALNCVAKKGTFEWALIQMKNIKAVRRSCWIKMRWWSFV